MNILPLGNRVLVKKLEEKNETNSGIIIPDTVEKHGSVKGEVIEVGLDMNVITGDTVLFAKFSGINIQFDGEDYIILREDDLLGIIVD